MYEVTIRPQWIIRRPGGLALPARVVELLVKVHEHCSLACAFKASGMSYRHAWELLHEGEQLFGEALVLMMRGKESSLTALGEKLVWADRRIMARPSLHSLRAAWLTRATEWKPRARQFKLDFVPSQTERYCLMCNDRALVSPGVQKLLSILRSEEYKTAVNQLPGYQTSESGTVTELDAAFLTLRTTIRKRKRAQAGLH